MIRPASAACFAFIRGVAKHRNGGTRLQLNGGACARRGTMMKMKSISLVAAFALASTAALAQGNATGGSPQPGASKATSGEDVNKSGAATTGCSRPSPKDSSTQGAGTAGAVDKKGCATSPGGTMKN